MNSLMWAQTMSTSNLMKQAHMSIDFTNKGDEANLSKCINMPDKENLIQSQYLKQLLKM